MLNIDQFKLAMDAGAAIIDTRDAMAFTQGFIPGSIFLGTDGKYLPLANSLFPVEETLLLVCNPVSQEKIFNGLSKMGFNNIKGILEGGFESWIKDLMPPL